jgi:hypothetical protein
MLKAQGIEREFNMEEIRPEKVIDGKELVVIQAQPVAEEPIISHRIDSSESLKRELRELIDVTKEALDTALLLQQEDPTSRNTEAVAKMADTVAKALQGLIALEQAEKGFEFKAQEVNRPAPKVTNNNLIVTTSDLIQKIVDNAKKQIEDKKHETKSSQ